MPQSQFAASLLNSGYVVLRQTRDHRALSPNYKVKVAPPQLASTLTPPGVIGGTPSAPYNVYSGGNQKMTNFRIYFTDSTLNEICGMRIGYAGAWTDVLGQQTGYSDSWDRRLNEEIVGVDLPYLPRDDRMTGLRLINNSGVVTQFGSDVSGRGWIHYQVENSNVFDFIVYFLTQNIYWVFAIWKSGDSSECSGCQCGGQSGGDDCQCGDGCNCGGAGSDHSLILTPQPSNVRMDKTLAQDSTSGSWEKLFNAKQQAGEDVIMALDFLADNDEEDAWVLYSGDDDDVWICSDESGRGELYIWTRDVGTATIPNHVTRIGHSSLTDNMLLNVEWSLSGVSGAFAANNVKKTSVAYKSWFTAYVKDKSGEVKDNADAVLRDALANVGVMYNDGTLKVQCGGGDCSHGAVVLNATICGIWSILQCETYVQTILKGPYLLTDALNFDQSNGWVTIIRQPYEDSFLGNDANFVILPKTDVFDYPASIDVDGTTTVSLVTNVFIDPDAPVSYLTRAAMASTDENSQKVFGYVCKVQDKNDTQSVTLGMKQLSVDKELASSTLAKIVPRTVQSVQTINPPVTLALRKNIEGDRLQKVSVLIGKYDVTV